jgi:hypothetical protein
MKQYLKMKDVFRDEMRVVGDSKNMLADDVGIIIGCYSGDKMAEYVLHSINSHDELVQMNKELLAALEAVIEWYDMEADHSIEPDFYNRMAACQVSEDMAREAIAKAKGGAA